MSYTWTVWYSVPLSRYLLLRITVSTAQYHGIYCSVSIVLCCVCSTRSVRQTDAPHCRSGALHSLQGSGSYSSAHESSSTVQVGKGTSPRQGTAHLLLFPTGRKGASPRQGTAHCLLFPTGRKGTSPRQGTAHCLLFPTGRKVSPPRQGTAHCLLFPTGRKVSPPRQGTAYLLLFLQLSSC